MFAWILILIPWLALLSLILHDATKEDSAGSAISIAAKNFKASIFWAILKARKLRGALSYGTSPTSVSKSPAKVMAANPTLTISAQAIKAVTNALTSAARAVAGR